MISGCVAVGRPRLTAVISHPPASRERPPASAARARYYCGVSLLSVFAANASCKGHVADSPKGMMQVQPAGCTMAYCS